MYRIIMYFDKKVTHLKHYTIIAIMDSETKRKINLETCTYVMELKKNIVSARFLAYFFINIL